MLDVLGDDVDDEEVVEEVDGAEVVVVAGFAAGAAVGVELELRESVR